VPTILQVFVCSRAGIVAPVSFDETPRRRVVTRTSTELTATRKTLAADP